MTFTTGYAVPQTDPPRPPCETLPTMDDLPSETIGEPGLPDEYHDLQPQLLSRTLVLTDYTRDQWFTGADLNLYYDVHHPLWYKRPDWFLAVNVPRLYGGHDMRHSYVTWQEGRSPDVVIEFLSPGTEAEDLGRFFATYDTLDDPTISDLPGLGGNGHQPQPPQPPRKFKVYEQYLRIPHYLVYNRKTQQLRYFQLVGGRYQEQPVAATAPSIWLTDLQIGLGLWEGCFEGIHSHWLRWCGEDGQWLLTDTEREQQAKEVERQAKEVERQAKEQLQAQLVQAAQNLLTTGMPLDQVVKLLGLSAEQQQQL